MSIELSYILRHSFIYFVVQLEKYKPFICQLQNNCNLWKKRLFHTYIITALLNHTTTTKLRKWKKKKYPTCKKINLLSELDNILDKREQDYFAKLIKNIFSFGIKYLSVNYCLNSLMSSFS